MKSNPAGISGAHIGIAGAGLLGRLLSWQLTRAGAKVSLFEAGSLSHPEAAAQTAAGMIAPVSEAVATEPYVYGLGNTSLQLWPQWLSDLEADTSVQVNYAQQGSLLVAHPQDQAELQQFENDIQRSLVAQGNQVPYQTVNSRDIQALESDLSDRLGQGLFLPDEAHIDNRQLLRTLLAYCQDRNVTCYENSPADVFPRQIKTADKTHDFDLVLDCRGVGAKNQWSKVRGVRGEVMSVQTSEISLSRPVRLMHPRYQLYVVPKANNCFVIGATQLESEDRSPVTLQSTLELGSALYTLSPAFAEANIIDLKSNLRPALPDNGPRIETEDGLIKINGLFRHGYLLAPVVIQHLLNFLSQGESLPYDQLLGLTNNTTQEINLA
jgi:glycine oxidase